MKKLNIVQRIIRNKVIKSSPALAVFFMANPILAQAVVLDPANKALTALQTDLKTLIPVAAAVILLCLAIGYAGRYISKDTFVRWGIGVVIAGSAAELANLLFKPS
ncbi:VirB2 family type IV secretion system major pilin TrwL [Bartonella krasnovii]|uniref:VirB2 family type IV secretion system major pilin TrwL n=1 Tax=Bartonella krasnovii TaxID=2267275 RepID=A0ABY3VZ71_9HYPH|nr:VirB2 family type IV secretion system major pilin TrwL [Bartonella krasnovii]UNF29002.1 VirB2 family type IV secretion system major pilin TrwL [Bartonella krasnovii]UNF35357.1 VirB2 family type IV secretion system major pilin TrwL [Bartonella krasnovii]UNF36986.1 VirB2 family type IV secretion system major pilin TrwL [Bartonella krasnovii]UNF40400.1 VirB2 family type IV secretion system major pilin TrwL [Bartonella krasnovii]UNF48544.1 VirB2 family type IV secretion system major pilin TrwL 